jgi:hypothetical protein
MKEMDDARVDKLLDELFDGEDIVKRILNSYKVGFFIPRKAISLIGFSLNLPILYSNRDIMLRNLLRASYYDGKLKDALQYIKNYAITFKSVYEELLNDYPELKPLLEEHLAKISMFVNDIEKVLMKIEK